MSLHIGLQLSGLQIHVPVAIRFQCVWSFRMGAMSEPHISQLPSLGCSLPHKWYSISHLLTLLRHLIRNYSRPPRMRSLILRRIDFEILTETITRKTGPNGKNTTTNCVEM